MKMLKKAGAIAIAGAMVMSLGTISALAEGEALTLGAIEYTPATAENTIATFKVPYTAAAGVNQVTLLAELGATEGVFANAIAYETTAYIDQEAADTYFEFKIDDSRLQLAEGQEKLFLNVKVGGTGVATPATKSLDITPKSAEPEAPITSDMVAGALLKVDGAAVTSYFGKENTGIMRLDVTDLITADAEGKVALDLATQVVKIDGVEARYTVYNGVTKLVALVDTAKEANVVEIVAKDGGSLQLKYGDADLDEASKLDAGDMSTLINMILATTAPESNAQYNHIAADADGDVKLDAGDMSTLINLILDSTLVPGADK